MPMRTVRFVPESRTNDAFHCPVQPTATISPPPPGLAMLKKGITPSDDLPPTGAKFRVEFGSSVAVRG